MAPYPTKNFAPPRLVSGLLAFALAGCATYSPLPLDKQARPSDSVAQLRHDARAATAARRRRGNAGVAEQP
jgi:hypothetical protein